MTKLMKRFSIMAMVALMLLLGRNTLLAEDANTEEEIVEDVFEDIEEEREEVVEETKEVEEVEAEDKDENKDEDKDEEGNYLILKRGSELPDLEEKPKEDETEIIEGSEDLIIEVEIEIIPEEEPKEEPKEEEPRVPYTPELPEEEPVENEPETPVKFELPKITAFVPEETNQPEETIVIPVTKPEPKNTEKIYVPETGLIRNNETNSVNVNIVAILLLAAIFVIAIPTEDKRKNIVK